MLPAREIMPTRGAKQDDETRLREAAQMYEEQFLGEMVKAMRRTIPESDFMKPSSAEKIFREQLDQQYVEAWADKGGIGLADLIVDQIKEAQSQIQARGQNAYSKPFKSK